MPHPSTLYWHIRMCLSQDRHLEQQDFVTQLSNAWGTANPLWPAGAVQLAN